jgi:hypothetical protein
MSPAIPFLAGRFAGIPEQRILERYRGVFFQPGADAGRFHRLPIEPVLIQAP